MKTEDLIKGLVADQVKTRSSMTDVWLWSVLTSVLISAAVFFLMVGWRADIAAAAATVRFLFKPAIALLLALLAIQCLAKLARPGAWRSGDRRLLFAAPAILVVAVVLEVFIVPAPEWGSRLVGTNALVCLATIPLLGIGPLAVSILALQHNAPTRPAVAGAVAGLSAGGLAAAFYALHCTDDSPLFVATWYTLAIAALALVGAVSARFAIRW